MTKHLLLGMLNAIVAVICFYVFCFCLISKEYIVGVIEMVLSIANFALSTINFIKYMKYRAE